MVDDSAAEKVVKLLLLVLVVLLCTIAYTFFAAYEGRKDLVKSQRAGCERAKLDRAANASGWRNAEAARRRDNDVDVANQYAEIADGLEERSKIDCATAFPKASFIP